MDDEEKQARPDQLNRAGIKELECRGQGPPFADRKDSLHRRKRSSLCVEIKELEDRLDSVLLVRMHCQNSREMEAG